MGLSGGMPGEYEVWICLDFVLYLVVYFSVIDVSVLTQGSLSFGTICGEIAGIILSI